MSFIAGRLAATEAAYFLQESKHAVGRLYQKKKNNLQDSPPPLPTNATHHSESHADVLHEVLRHSIPFKAIQPLHPSPPSLSPASQWRPSPSLPLPPSLSSDALNPPRAVLSLPQVTFGPRRWQLPNEQPAILPSTANELRLDRQTHVDSKKLKDAAEGLSQIGKAIAIATTIVFGGGTLTFMLTASKLQLNSSEDIRKKGKDLLQPRFDAVREQLGPLRDWAENMSRKWHWEEETKEKPVFVKEISKRLGVKTPN